MTRGGMSWGCYLLLASYPQGAFLGHPLYHSSFAGPREGAESTVTDGWVCAWECMERHHLFMLLLMMVLTRSQVLAGYNTLVEAFLTPFSSIIDPTEASSSDC